MSSQQRQSHMVLPVAPSATSSVELKTGRRMILDSPVYSSNASLKVPKLSPTNKIGPGSKKFSYGA